MFLISGVQRDLYSATELDAPPSPLYALSNRSSVSSRVSIVVVVGVGVGVVDISNLGSFSSSHCYQIQSNGIWRLPLTFLNLMMVCTHQTRRGTRRLTWEGLSVRSEEFGTLGAS